MDEQNEYKRPVNPRRRKRSQLQIIKEDYLPYAIIGLSLILVLIFAIGSIVRAVQNKNYNKMISQQAAIAAQAEQDRLANQAKSLMAEAEVLANQFDYAGAIAVLDRFEGNMYDFKELSDKYAEYAAADASLVLWNDPSKVTNLSFHPLIADTSRAFAEKNGSFYANNYITVSEFSKILLQLYENGYILIRHSDIKLENGEMNLRLPNGKKPLIITETNVCYDTVLVDGEDSDTLPDQEGKGFASKLVLDSTGKLTCQMVDSSGKIVTGDFDIVPILESFIESHPDFSYRGARAVLALSGSDGVFGYRTNASANTNDYSHDVEVAEATKIIAAVKNAGYELACYSYGNKAYGELNPDQIRSDLESWKVEVAPLLGDITMFVFPRSSDIADNGTGYTGGKLEILQSYGFTNFVGFSKNGESWYQAFSGYTRMNRIMVTGSNLSTYPTWFENMFDTYSIKDSARK